MLPAAPCLRPWSAERQRIPDGGGTACFSYGIHIVSNRAGGGYAAAWQDTGIKNSDLIGFNAKHYGYRTNLLGPLVAHFWTIPTRHTRYHQIYPDLK